MDAPLILGIGGTYRSDSTSEKALAVSLRGAEEAGARTMMISGRALMLPIYNPAALEPQDAAMALVKAFRDCDGIIVSAAAYHGSVSGLLKNALDYAEELREDSRVYFDGIAFGSVVVAAGWQAGGQTMTTLRSIAHALRAWPTPMGALLNSATSLFDEAGQCVDQKTEAQLKMVGRQVTEFAQWPRLTGQAC